MALARKFVGFISDTWKQIKDDWRDSFKGTGQYWLPTHK